MAVINSVQDSLKSRLGSDLQFPISGNFQTISGTDLLLQDIQMLLLTLPGERLNRPNFGCQLRNQVWENIRQAKLDGINSIRTSLDSYEPRISVTNIAADINENTGLITFNIQFVVLATNSIMNLVFPFRVGSQLSFS